MIVFIVLVTLLILYIVYENHTRNKELLKYAPTDALTALYKKETTEQLTDELLSEAEIGHVGEGDSYHVEGNTMLTTPEAVSYTHLWIFNIRISIFSHII